jgi:hypothetical protein
MLKRDTRKVNCINAIEFPGGTGAVHRLQHRESSPGQRTFTTGLGPVDFRACRPRGGSQNAAVGLLEHVGARIESESDGRYNTGRQHQLKTVRAKAQGAIFRIDAVFD